MSTFLNPTVTGVVTQSDPAVGPHELVRLQEMLVADSGLARRVHSHEAADITDLGTAVGAVLNAQLLNTDTVEWTYPPGQVAASVRRKTNGGVLADASGLSLDFGSGVSQVPRGDHTHEGMHPPVTGENSQSAGVTIVGQLLRVDVIRAPSGGLLETPTGLALDFGTSPTQAAPGDHTHADAHPAVSVTETDSLSLYAAPETQELSGIVRLDPAPGPGRGALGTGVGGLHCVLGTGPNVAAAGNHIHTAATVGVAGFMSAQDKAKLDELVLDVLSGVPLTTPATDSIILAYDSDTEVLSGTLRIDPAPPSGYGRLARSAQGVRVVLGSTADTAAAGNHTHPVPTGDGFRSIVADEEESVARRVVDGDVDDGAGIVETKLALNFPTHSAANDPTADQKAALAGTSGAPGASNRYVTQADPRFTQERFDIRLDGNGATLAAAVLAAQIVPVAGVITGWEIVADAVGNVVVDVRKTNYTGFPTSVSITGTEKPTLTGAQINRNLALTTWNTAIGPEDVLLFEISAPSGIRRADLQLRWTRT